MQTYVIKRCNEEFGVMRGMPLGVPGAEIAAIDTILAGMYNKEGKDTNVSRRIVGRTHIILITLRNEVTGNVLQI